MNNSYFIKEFSESDYRDLQSGASLFSSVKWMLLFKNCYGINYKKVVDKYGCFILSFAVIDHAFANKVSILPYCDYIDFEKVNTTNIQNVLMFLNQSYPEHHIIYKSNFEKETIPTDLNIEKNACYHVIHTSKGQAVHTKPAFRSKVKKALKSGLSSRLNYEKSAIDDFYKIYKELRFTKFRSIPQPLSFFYGVWDSYIITRQGFVLEVLHKEKVVASAIILEHKKTLFYKFSCSRTKYLHMAPNNLLMQTLIDFAKSKLYNEINLGMNDKGPSYKGLKSYKESCGGVELPITYVSLKPMGKKDFDSSNLPQKIANFAVDQNLDTRQVSSLSEIIYPFFA